MSSSGARLKMSAEMFTQISGTIYVALATNVLVVLAAIPVLTVLVTTDVSQSWPLLALVAPLTAPALCAAFAVFSSFSHDGSTKVVRTFARAWWSSARQSLTLGALTTALCTVFVVDILVVWNHRAGAVAIPVLVGLTVLVTVTFQLGLVAIAERPSLRLRTVVKASLYLSVRRWYLTAVSAVAFLLWASLIVQRPGIGLGIATAPLLYLIWANGRHTLRSILGEPTAHTDTTTLATVPRLEPARP